MPNEEPVEYELYAGNAPHFPTMEIGDDGLPVREDFKEGDRLFHTMKLDKMWPAKFIRVDRTERLSAAKQAKRAKTMKATKPAPVETTADEDEDQEPTETLAASEHDANDMTKDFKLAVDNDLKVTYVVAKGYTIHDGDKIVNDKPIRAKKDVETKLKSYTHGKGD